MVTEEIVQEYLQEHRRAGLQDGLRESVTTVFTVRFGPPPDDVVAIVSRTKDVDLLRSWVKLVAVAPMQDALASIRGGTAPR